MSKSEINETQRFLSASTRTLGLVDCNPFSQTAGCADRNYWHYQDGKGFAVGSFQVGMLGLAAATEATSRSSRDFSLASRLAAMWWAKEILRKPALDEYFKNQDSFCATAYTSFVASVLCAHGAKNLSLDAEELKLLRSALGKSLNWMTQQKERPDAANQTLAARIAWDLFFDQDPKNNPFQPRRVVDPEGDLAWYAEYGGIDLGYSLKCLDLCAFALSTLQKPEARKTYLKIAEDLLRTLRVLIVDFTYSPAVSSRGNPHALLGGLKLFASSGWETAREILQELENTDRFGFLVPAESCDDKYLSFFHLNSLVLSWKSAGAESSLLPYPFERSSIQAFVSPELLQLKSAGLLFWRNKLGDRAAVSVQGGGAVHLEKRGVAQTHSGYLVRRDGKIWGPAALQKLPEVIAAPDGWTLRYPLLVRRISQKVAIVQNSAFHVLLNLALATPVVSSFVKKLISASTHPSSAGVPVGERTLQFSRERGASIQDRLDLAATDRAVPFGEWCLTDGHSSRLTSLPFERFGSPKKEGPMQLVHWPQ
jgi:hypothetical protein